MSLYGKESVLENKTGTEYDKKVTKGTDLSVPQGVVSRSLKQNDFLNHALC